MIFIGLDPGKGGGIAFLDEAGYVKFVGGMPDTDRGVLEILTMRFEDEPVVAANLARRAAIERVGAGAWGRPGARMGATSAFTFGQGYGALLMALAACEIPYEQVSPLRWQTALSCRTGGHKNVSKKRAQELFPSVKSITHKTADALLIAEFARRLEVRA